MELSTRKSPPPLPESVGSGIDRMKVVAAFLGIAILLAVLLVAIFASMDGTVDGKGAGGSATSGDGDGNGTSKGGDDEEAGQDENGAAEKEEQADALDGDADSSSGSNNPSADSEEDGETDADVSTNSNGSGNPETDLPPGVTLDGPQSERGVRNTFNPFGGDKPPKTSSPEETGPNESGKSAEFFGVAAEGKSFVYVVDKSSSMMGEKFEGAREELIESINSLRPNQSFFVIFFDTSFHPQETKGLVKATSRNKKKVKAWIDLAGPSGGTDPYEAIVQALNLKPDAIFVLSDGEFEYYLADQVKVINNHFTIPIHTIAFTSNAQTLKDLADQNKGTYRFVP